jgi:hypothetical protein
LASIAEERARLQALEANGCGNETIHIVYVEREAKARAENAGPKPKTRFIFEVDSPEAYAELNREKDRWLRVIVNKQVAISLLIAAWAKPSDDELRRAAEGIEEASGETLGSA